MEKQVKYIEPAILTRKFVKVGAVVRIASLGIAFLAIYMMSL